MNFVIVNPLERFSGIDEKGWLVYPNAYHCRFCNFGVSFSQEALTKEAYWNRADPIQLSKLKGEAKTVLEIEVRESVAHEPGLFAVGFHCPKCHAPVAITFDVNEFAMGYYRFKPLAIFETERPPNKAPQPTPKSGAAEL